MNCPYSPTDWVRSDYAEDASMQREDRKTEKKTISHEQVLAQLGLSEFPAIG